MNSLFPVFSLNPKIVHSDLQQPFIITKIVWLVLYFMFTRGLVTLIKKTPREKPLEVLITIYVSLPFSSSFLMIHRLINPWLINPYQCSPPTPSQKFCRVIIKIRIPNQPLIMSVQVYIQPISIFNVPLTMKQSLDYFVNKEMQFIVRPRIFGFFFYLHYVHQVYQVSQN